MAIKTKKIKSLFRFSKSMPPAQGSLDLIKPVEYELTRHDISNYYLQFVNSNASRFELDVFDLVELKKVVAYAIWHRIKNQKSKTAWIAKIADFLQLCVATIRRLCIPPKKKA